MSKIIIALLVLAIPAFCKFPEKLDDKKLASIKEQVEIEAEQLRQTSDTTKFLNPYQKELTIEFKLDTFRIERSLELKIEIDYSTLGMVESTYEAESEYDKLLNKYYKKLLHKLNEEDQITLLESQRNWLKFRDSERILSRELADEEYSGGGTIQKIILAGKSLEITKQRVFELYHYLHRFYE